MTHLFVGLGNAGSGILNALWEYKEVRRTKPIVIMPKSGNGETDKIEAMLKNAKEVDLAFILSGFSDSSNITAAELLADRCKKPLFIAVLPANRREERDAIISSYHSLDTLKEHVKSFILVDNQRIAHHPNYKEFYPRYNKYIAACLVDILAGIQVKKPQTILHVDELENALSFGDDPGYVALSRTSELTQGLMGYIFPFMKHKPLDLRTLLRVSLEKFSVSDVPIGCEKSVSFLRVPDYYVRSVDKSLMEDFMLTYSKETHLAVSTTRRNMAAVTNLFIYKFEQLGRLRDIRGFAYGEI